MRAPLSAKRLHVFDASNQYYVGGSQNGFMIERILLTGLTWNFAPLRLGGFAFKAVSNYIEIDSQR